MGKMKRKYISIAVMSFWVISTAFSISPKLNPQDKLKDVKGTFKLIEKGINEGDITFFTEHFSEKTYLSLKDVAHDYYSINQVHYVLKDFFSINRVVSFRFNNIVEDANQPFATGLFVYSRKGRRDSAVIFVSLKKVKDTWKISQLSIN